MDQTALNTGINAIVGLGTLGTAIVATWQIAAYRREKRSLVARELITFVYEPLLRELSIVRANPRMDPDSISPKWNELVSKRPDLAPRAIREVGLAATVLHDTGLAQRKIWRRMERAERESLHDALADTGRSVTDRSLAIAVEIESDAGSSYRLAPIWSYWISGIGLADQAAAWGSESDLRVTGYCLFVGNEKFRLDTEVACAFFDDAAKRFCSTAVGAEFARLFSERRDACESLYQRIAAEKQRLESLLPTA